MTSGNRTTGNSMKATDGTASAIQVTYNISGGLLGGVQATNSNMYGTHTIGTGGLNMWKQAYGYDLDAAKTTRGGMRPWFLGWEASSPPVTLASPDFRPIVPIRCLPCSP